MSTRRVAAITRVPIIIKRMFRGANDPQTNEERMWRERAARMTLDALGFTNLAVKPLRHNDAVRYARRWFRQLYADQQDPSIDDNAIATFDSAGILFPDVRDAVLRFTPKMYPDPNEESDDDVSTEDDSGRPGDDKPLPDAGDDSRSSR